MTNLRTGRNPLAACAPGTVSSVVDRPSAYPEMEIKMDEEKPWWQSTEPFPIFRPWWRAALFAGAILWLVLFNIFYIGGGASNNWLGITSVVPIFVLLVEALVRMARSGRHP